MGVGEASSTFDLGGRGGRFTKQHHAYLTVDVWSWWEGLSVVAFSIGTNDEWPDTLLVHAIPS
jgi:hypothetical protein